MGVRPHRKRLELMLMVLIGLAWGLLLSELMKRTRWQNRSERLKEESSPFPSSQRSRILATPPTTAPPTTSPPPDIHRLFNETRVLCMVLTSPKTHHTRAIHIKRTWGGRCNKLIFMSTKADRELGSVALNVREGYSNLWPKTRAALQYVYKHHFQKYDWFLKADDDTYVIMENLLAFLHAYDFREPVYFGNKFRQHVKEGYMSGGAGYVLSKMALHRLVKLGFGNSSICTSRNYGYEDVELGRCLAGVAVVGGDSRDEHGLSRFVPFSPLHWYPQPPEWYQPLLYYTSPDNSSDCCSNTAISFHYNNAQEFYVLDYIIYKLRVFGLNRELGQLPKKKGISKPTLIYFQAKTAELDQNALNKMLPGKNVTKPNYRTKITSKIKK
ncbi:glycoprotein-N-acetylgalactosamine 3-beta-galactosyltransferase 1 [Drosophila santomea]|uniref:glycoprotein-N-acetylgalactosamine 3-beta-galactosyltransferase 1 n=1 Tax=Drosophila santomea TaxID=129105 RepID=UPI00195455E6|nr:glycoprotein-N-acetylgalactosamine 3-beta-galactosyltransferase 1 [Drosophila santomea]